MLVLTRGLVCSYSIEAWYARTHSRSGILVLTRGNKLTTQGRCCCSSHVAPPRIVRSVSLPLHAYQPLTADIHVYVYSCPCQFATPAQFRFPHFKYHASVDIEYSCRIRGTVAVAGQEVPGTQADWTSGWPYTHHSMVIIS